MMDVKCGVVVELTGDFADDVSIALVISVLGQSDGGGYVGWLGCSRYDVGQYGNSESLRPCVGSPASLLKMGRQKCGIISDRRKKG